MSSIITTVWNSSKENDRSSKYFCDEDKTTEAASETAPVIQNLISHPLGSIDV